MKNDEFLCLKNFSTTIFKDFRLFFFFHIHVEGAPCASLRSQLEIGNFLIDDNEANPPVAKIKIYNIYIFWLPNKFQAICGRMQQKYIGNFFLLEIFVLTILSDI